MAFTVVNTPTVFGNKQVRLLKITADSATQAVETGLSVIEHADRFEASCASNGFKMALNSNCSGVQSMGVLGISGVANGDLFYVTVYGR